MGIRLGMHGSARSRRWSVQAATAVPDEEREQLETYLEQMREADWQRVRDEVLTEEQRRRIPGK